MHEILKLDIKNGFTIQKITLQIKKKTCLQSTADYFVNKITSWITAFNKLVKEC